MNPFIAPANLMSAMLFDSTQDAYLRKGFHLRIFAGAGASFPVAPFFIYKVKGMHLPENEAAHAALGPFPGERFISGAINTHGRQVVRLEFLPQQGVIDAITLLDGVKSIATRTSGPWVFSMPAWSSARVAGTAKGLMARGIGAPDDIVDGHGQLGERIAPGLALRAGDGAGSKWYVGREPMEERQRRVGDGAPQVWGPREQHVFGRWRLDNSGAFVPLPAPVPNARPTPGQESNEENARVRKVMSDSPALPEVVETMVNTESVAPWEQIAVVSDPKGAAEYNPLQMLQLGMGDPGIARHFGYATSWSRDALSFEEDELLAVVTLIAFDPRRIPQADEGMLSYTIDKMRAQPTSKAVIAQILQAIKNDHLSDDPEAEFKAIKQRADSLGLIVAPFVTYTTPVTPYEPPSLSAPQVVKRQWAPSEGRSPSDKYSAVFAFRDVPMSMLALLERQDNADFVPRSGSTLDDGDDAYKHWLKPSVLGRESESTSRAKELRLLVKGQPAASVLYDQQIPVGAGIPPTRKYRASVSDAFGRFGAAVQFDVGPPNRPRPTAPRMTYLYAPMHTAPAGEGAASPGSITVMARFDTDSNNPSNASEIAVPSVAASPRGALEISTFEITLAGTAVAFGDSVPATLPATPAISLTRAHPSATIELPALSPMARARMTLKGVFVDASGARSEESAVQFSVSDARAPQPLTTGVGLLWTTRPSPAPEVVVDLVWPAPAGSEHHVYVGDERTLMEPLDAPRCVRGTRLCEEVRFHDIERYQRVTPAPIKANAQNLVIYSLKLPRTLESVQVVRVVPLGPDGAEPPFSACTTVPVAVPSSRRAPPPLLMGEVDPGSGTARLRIVAEGLNIHELQGEQPGLFDAAAQGREVPTFRLRSSDGPVSHPLYAPIQMVAGASETGELPLTLKSEEANGERRYWFEASVEGKQLLPFVRYVYWAEVRLPPERCVPADTLQREGGIRSPHAESARPAPRLWGEHSAPLVLMHAPHPEAIAEDDLKIDIGNTTPQGVGVRLTLLKPPALSDKAVDSFKLGAWYRWGDGPLKPVLDGGGQSLDGRWPVAGSVNEVLVEPSATLGAKLAMHLALIDPVNRLGPVTIRSA